MAVKQLAVESLRIDGGTQLREKIDQATVDDYREGWVNNVEFPPLVVYHDGVHYWLAGGFHRYLGADAACVPTVPCDVRSGTQRDAVLFAAGDNQTNGLRRTGEDKRKAIRTLLEDKEWGKRSDRWVAEQCGVGDKLVAEVRSQVRENAPDGTPQKRVGKDGKEYTVAKPKAQVRENAPDDKPAKKKPPAGNNFNPADWEGEPDKPPAKPAVTKDREGNELPPHLHPVAESTWRADTVKLLNRLIEETKKNALPPGGMWTDLAEAIAGLHQARNILVNSQFYCLCPSCGGAKKGCEDCRKSGWFPRWRLDEWNNYKGKK